MRATDEVVPEEAEEEGDTNSQQSEHEQSELDVPSVSSWGVKT